MLYERYGTNPQLGELLLDSETFAPMPKIDDRQAWESLLPESRRTWIGLAETYSDFAWPAIKVSDYMAFWRTGDIGTRSNAVFERRSVLGILTIAECMENEGRFLDPIMNGVYAICEETTWTPPLHRLHWKVNMDEILPDASDHMVELITAETAKLLVWVRYLLGSRFDAISARIGERIAREVRDRLLLPYLARDDYWWMGFLEGVRVNNWNPWCNGAALTGFLLLETDPGAREAGIRKIMRSLDAFIRTYPADGCCDEGPSYWSSSGGGLLDCLELLHLASEGRIDAFGEPIVRDIGAYLYKVHVHGPYYVPFADCDVKADPVGDAVYQYGVRTNDESLKRLGASRPKSGPPRIHIWFGMYGHLRDLFHERERLAHAQQAPYVREAWLGTTHVMTAREREGTETGLFVAAKGGHNAESHNHNDVGSFVVFADGRPLLIDLGTEEYNRETFGADRYGIWYMQSQYHNLPTVRGVMQAAGASFRAERAEFRSGEDAAEAAFDIAAAYPAEAGIGFWRRTVRLVRGPEAAVEVVDEFALTGEPAGVFYSLMTPCAPELAGEGIVRLRYAPDRTARIRYDSAFATARIEPVERMESRLRRNWGDSMYRIVLEERGPVSGGSRRIAVLLDR